MPAAGIGSICDTLCMVSPSDEAATVLRPGRRDHRMARRPLLGRPSPCARRRASTTARRSPPTTWSSRFDILKAKGAAAYTPSYYARRAEGGEARRAQREVHLPRRRQQRAAADRRPAAGPASSILGDAAISRRRRSRSPLGSGPYKVDSFDAGRSITLSPRRRTTGPSDLPVNRGRNNFDTIRYDYYRDADRRVRSLQGGRDRLSARESRRATGRSRYDIPAVKAGSSSARLNPERAAAAACRASASTSRRALFKDRRVREALGHAVRFRMDQQEPVYGPTRARNSYFSNSELAATGLPTPEELKILEPLRGKIPDEVFTTGISSRRRPTARGNIREQSAPALALLKEAGWAIKDGKLTRQGDRPAVRLRDPAERAALRARHPALQQEPGAHRHRRCTCAPSTPRSTRTASTTSTST